MNRTTCQSVQERLVEYLKLELPEIEEVAILRHLGQCPSCESQRKSLEQTLRHVESFGDFEPSPGGFEDLMARIRADEGAEVRSAASPRLVRYAAAAAIAAGLTAGVFVIWREPRPVAVPAEESLAVDVDSGSVRLVEGGAGSTIEAPDRRTIAFGASIENASPHVARLRIAEIGTLHLDAATRIRIVEPRFLRLESGQILLEALPATATRPPLSVETPHATATVTGTTLDLSAAGDQTTLTVLEGHVSFRAGGAEQHVPAGQQSLAVSGGPPSAPEVVPELWRFHTWTTLAAEISLERGAVQPGERATLRFQLVNRSASPLALQANVNPPFFSLRYRHGDQVRPAWMTGQESVPGGPGVKDEARFKEIVPRPARDGVLRLEPGEHYEFSYRLDELADLGLHRIEILYNNGQEGTSSEPRLWRGFLQATADLWVVDASGRTSVPLGLVGEPAPSERTYRLTLVDLLLEEARVLAGCTSADVSWRDVIGRILAETPVEEAGAAIAEVLSVDPGNVRIERAGR